MKIRKKKKKFISLLNIYSNVKLSDLKKLFFKNFLKVNDQINSMNIQIILYY